MLESKEGGIYYPPELRLSTAEWDVIRIGATVLKPIRDAQVMFEGEFYPTNSLAVPIIYDIRDGIEQALLHQEAQKATDTLATDIIKALEELRDAFNQRFGDGSRVLPGNTPHGYARTASGKQPVGFTLHQVLATAVDPRVGVSKLYGVPESEKADVWTALGSYSLQMALLDDKTDIGAHNSPPPHQPAPVALARFLDTPLRLEPSTKKRGFMMMDDDDDDDDDNAPSQMTHPPAA